MTDEAPSLALHQGGIAFQAAAQVTGVVAGHDIHALQVTLPSPAGVPALHQLRAPVGDFIGRSAAFTTLIATLRRADGTSTVISGIRGMGGIGKTEFALKVATALQADFPDAQLFLELHGTTLDATTPAALLQQAIRAFAPTAVLPTDLSSLQRQYTSLLTGKRVLVLADDARDVEQVRPLLPPLGCVLLVTSRTRFTLPGLLTYDLDLLPADEAAQLLLDLCPRIQAAAPQLAALCGYLPLALRVVGSVLRTDATRTIASYLSRLEARQTRLAALQDPADSTLNVEGVLGLSYELLDRPAQAVLEQLSVFTGSFDRVAARTIVKPPSGKRVEITEILAQLYRRNLVSYDLDTERYWLHDLIQVFAAQRLRTTPMAAARRRHAKYYQIVTQKAEDLFKRGGEATVQGLRLFDAESFQIQAAWNWLVAQVDSPQAERDQLLIDYVSATVNIAYLRLHLRDVYLPRLNTALIAATRQANLAAELMILGNLGLVYADLGQPAKAVEYYQRILPTVRMIGAEATEGAALGNLGLAYADLGQTTEAISCHQQHLAIARRIHNQQWEANALGNLGSAYTALGQWQAAFEYTQQHLQIARNRKDRHSESNALGNLAKIYVAMDNTDQALAHYKAMLLISQELGDTRNIAFASWNIGILLKAQGKLAEAIALMQIRVDYEHLIGHRDAENNAATVAELRQQWAATV